MPVYFVQCTVDECVDAENRDAMVAAARVTDAVGAFEGYAHNSWSFDRSEEVIGRSVRFVLDGFGF